MLYRAESETKLIREAQNVLKANGLETVDVLFNGSRGLLSGQVGSPSVRNQALELVSGLDGVRSVSVDGIRVEPTLPTATAMNLPDIGASRSLQ